MQVKTIGLDLAKDVFQVHGVSVTGDKVFNKKIKQFAIDSDIEQSQIPQISRMFETRTDGPNLLW